MKKWIIITKDDDKDPQEWNVRGLAGFIIDRNTRRAVFSEAELKSAVGSNADIVVIINRKERRIYKQEFIILNPQLIEAIWIHFGNLNFNDLNTKEKVDKYWKDTCKDLNFEIVPGKELEVFPISSQKLPWSDEIEFFRNTFDPQYLENARTKARQHYENKEIKVFLPFYLEVLCRLKEAEVTGNKQLDIEALRHSWEAARKQWEETHSPVAKAFLAIGPDFKDEDLKTFCKAYRECSADCTKQLGPAEMK